MIRLCALCEPILYKQFEYQMRSNLLLSPHKLINEAIAYSAPSIRSLFKSTGQKSLQ